MKRAQTRLIEGYRYVALIVRPIHKLYYSIPVIVLSAIYLTKGDIDLASKTFTELATTRTFTHASSSTTQRS